MIAIIVNGALAISNKSKPNAFSPGTPANNRKTKKQKLKPAAGAKDFTKASLFHCANGTPTSDLFPSGLSKPLCGYFCFHNKKCSKSNQACEINHIGKWDKFPVEDQAKFWLITICSMERKSGLMQIHSRSTERPFLTSFLIS
jgi:hypothetical protein